MGPDLISVELSHFQQEHIISFVVTIFIEEIMGPVIVWSTGVLIWCKYMATVRNAFQLLFYSLIIFWQNIFSHLVVYHCHSIIN